MDARTLVLRNARVHTFSGDDVQPVNAIALREGRVVAVGGEADAWSAVGSDAPSVDLRGRTLLPGLVDAHVHWTGYALSRRELWIEPTEDLPTVLRRVKETAAGLPAGKWIVGRGWDHTSWERWPTAGDLDSSANRHPVMLIRKDGHVAWVNTAALATAGIDARTLDPEGGKIDRAHGEATGILKERAVELVRRSIPQATEDDRLDAIASAWSHAWALGLTGCHDMGYGVRSCYRDLSKLKDAGRLGLRFVWYLPEAELEEAVGLGLRSGMGDAWLRLGGLKLFLDGTLGSRTAHMLEPYDDEPGNVGIRTLGRDALFATLTTAAEAGISSATHAIGDAANREALEAFESVLRDPDTGGPLKSLPASALRPRIEHAQLIDPDDFSRFARAGVTASMQPIHATVDYPTALAGWGDRCRNAYAWRSLLDSGAHLVFGSDAPIETLDPLAGIHAAVTRQTASGQPFDGWIPEQRISAREALNAYTRAPAQAIGQAKAQGHLGLGALADMIVLDRDPLEADPAELPDIQILATMIDGLWVWQAQDVALAGPRQDPRD